MDDGDGIAAAREREWRQPARIDAAFTEGRIDRAAWHAAVPALIHGGSFELVFAVGARGRSTREECWANSPW